MTPVVTFVQSTMSDTPSNRLITGNPGSPNPTLVRQDHLQQSHRDRIVRATDAQCSNLNSDSLQEQTQSDTLALGGNQELLDEAYVQTSLSNEVLETSYLRPEPVQSSNADGSAFDPTARQGSHSHWDQTAALGNWDNWDPIIQQTWNNSIVVPPQFDSNPTIHQTWNNSTAIPPQLDSNPIIHQTWNNSTAIPPQFDLSWDSTNIPQQCNRDPIIQQTWNNSAAVPSQHYLDPAIHQTWNNSAAVSSQYDPELIIQQTWNNSAAVSQYNLDPTNTQYPAWNSAADTPQNWENRANAIAIPT
jgi:hypothetical protein